MLSILHKGVEPTASVADSITYFTAIKHLKTIAGDCSTAVEMIKELMGSPKTRLFGLMLLKISLEQNSDVYVKGNWHFMLRDILFDSSAHSLKQQACDIYCIILPFMYKEYSTYPTNLQNFAKDIFPFLLKKINEPSQWSIAALKCVRASLKSAPQALEQHKGEALKQILRKISYTVSSAEMELVADCFAELPNIDQNPATNPGVWNKQITITLNTLSHLLNAFLENDEFYDDFDESNDKGGVYIFHEDDDKKSKDMYHAYFQGARQYINLCKCCARMLSTMSRYTVEVPLRTILIVTSRLFKAEDLKKLKPTTLETQIFCSCLSQMQLATLTIIEAILENIRLLRYSESVAQILHSALVASRLTNISVETVSELHHATWKLLKIFLQKYGSSVSADILKMDLIIQNLLADITIEENRSLQSVPSQTSPKSKKLVAVSGKKKCFNENHRQVCKEALNALEQLVHTGTPYFEKNQFQDIFSKVVEIAKLLQTTCKYPFPYDDGKCRKHLYRLLLALTLTSKKEYNELEQSGVGLLRRALQDPCSEVTGFCNFAMSALNAKLYPRRPPPKYQYPTQKKAVRFSNAIVKCPEWTSDEFIPNLPLEDTLKGTLSRTFHDPNEDAVLEEPMESVVAMEEVVGAEPHYSESYVSECYVSKYAEQRTENQHNGEDLLLDTSQHQEEDSEEEDDDEDEDEEEDDRSYGDEEMNQSLLPDNSYIPGTSKMQISNQAHISPDSVQQDVDREYEQLRSCAKAETSNMDSNKNRHLNGIRNVMSEVPSSSTQSSLANENGVFGCDEEELDDDDEEGDEDEEDDRASFPSEKRIPEFYPPNPPSKRPKLDIEEPKAEEEVEESPRSPTLEEMKAAFCCTEIEDIKS